MNVSFAWKVLMRIIRECQLFVAAEKTRLIFTYLVFINGLNNLETAPVVGNGCGGKNFRRPAFTPLQQYYRNDVTMTYGTRCLEISLPY